MTADRKRLLELRAKSLAAINQNPDLPPDLRAAYKKAADHADAALLLDEAAQAKQQNLPPDQTSSSGDPTAQPL
jgi:hypothetical protein